MQTPPAGYIAIRARHLHRGNEIYAEGKQLFRVTSVRHKAGLVEFTCRNQHGKEYHEQREPHIELWVRLCPFCQAKYADNPEVWRVLEDDVLRKEYYIGCIRSCDYCSEDAERAGVTDPAEILSPEQLQAWNTSEK